MKETLTASLKEEEGKEGPKWRMKGEGYFASQEREEKGGQKLEWKIASKFPPLQLRDGKGGAHSAATRGEK